MPSLYPILLPRADGQAVAACAFVGSGARLTASERVQLLPSGEFRSLDGRPTECAAWYIDGDIAQRLIDEARARKTPYVLDYHHQSLVAMEKGITAPAAGWFKALEWTDEAGLFATDVQWTEAARQLIEGGELRYVSPVFTWDRATGRVAHLINAALTNNPGIDGMDAVADSVAAALAAVHAVSLESGMDELIDRLRYFLNLPITATASDCVAELQKLIDQIGADAAGDVAAAHVSPAQRFVAALSAAGTPDSAHFVPMAVHQAVQSELAAAHASLERAKHDALMRAALADGRISPTTQAYWEGQPLAVLRSYLDVAQPIAALTGLQSGGRPPAASGAGAAGSSYSMAGYTVDAERLALHRRAMAYASEHQCGYREAVVALTANFS
ncbi:MAG TPA: phage protease [Accumulibacter sp.]|uniref:phage protease n=1 Tax=Accumulibacter sp. TaxID=2053492 RepID=UPI002B743CEF|nr:phage protease [Accumulibacter sp.]HMW55135.1 phage protease [Accumulibacter sp.]